MGGQQMLKHGEDELAANSDDEKDCLGLRGVKIT